MNTPHDTLAWFVGTPDETDWELVRGATEQEAIDNYLADRGIDPVCEAVADGAASPPDECECEACFSRRSLDAIRAPELDDVPSPTKAQLFDYCMMPCSRCGELASILDGGRVVDTQIVCGDCLTIEERDEDFPR
jgi:hypothetical protein